MNGDRLWNGVFHWFPAPVGPTVRQAFRQNFQNSFIGQITLALLMEISMTISFLVIKVPFGLLFGLGIGLLALFPFGTSPSADRRSYRTQSSLDHRLLISWSQDWWPYRIDYCCSPGKFDQIYCRYTQFSYTKDLCAGGSFN
ncbi:MAG: AI-2E family transporter [Synechococcaceae cyanobacterium SM2_3_1]|nr:AI-2E family transporter [Synechococcaceae cyanobacterium SM2_3_1]